MSSTRQRTSDTILMRESDPRWASVAADDLDATLADHAHCEKKAAASAIALINAYPDDHELVRALAPLAVEEMEHFEEVYAILRERKAPLGRDAGDPYVQELMKLVRSKNAERKIDRLIVAALIEARSCERFRLLKEELERRGESQLAACFRRFESSEAGHAVLFLRLARLSPKGESCDRRLAELAEAEAEIVKGLPLLPRIH